MKTRAQITLPGRISEAEDLWYDTRRWPMFVEGFHHVVSGQEGWPGEGTLKWASTPDGRGLVIEKVVRYEPRVGQTVEIEDTKSTGTQRVAFALTPANDVLVTLELDYRLKERPGGPLFGVVDGLFIRPRQREALQRTLTRFARELASDRRLTDGG